MILNAALAEAVDDGAIPSNVAAGIKLPSMKKKVNVPRWDPVQLAAFLAEAENDPLGVFWYLTVLEGCGAERPWGFGGMTFNGPRMSRSRSRTSPRR
jgi:hypothetical protein